MRNKSFLTLILGFSALSSIFSQSLKDKAYLLVKYDETSVADSTDLQKKGYDVMGLEIGEKMSRFYSISLLETKNAMMEQIRQTGIIDMRNIAVPKNRRGKQNIIYKNYVSKKLTLNENLGMFNYSIQESIPTIDWKIQSDTMHILNYSCQKAICQFRGRNYEAWFTPDINISEGPWKFSGLPGLILKVTESKGFFIFECKSVFKNFM